MRIASRRDLDVGMVWVNSQNVRHLPTPFGGTKAAASAATAAITRFDFYMETKNICLAHGTHTCPETGRLS